MIEDFIGNHKRVCATVDLDAILYNMEQMIEKSSE